MNRGTSKDFFVLIFFCGLSLLLGRWQTNYRLQGRYDPVSQVVSTILEPGSAALTLAADRTSEFMDGLVHARSLKADNQRLKDLLLSYSHYTDTVTRLNMEVDQLRRMSGFGDLPGKVRQPADIVKAFPYEHRVTLNVGTAQGVKAGMPVVAPGGMFGRVQAVGARECTVTMISSADPTNRIGAMVVRPAPNDPSPGLMRGEGPNRLILDFVDPRAPVDPNDMVMTSGFSEWIPRGIPIGHVIQVVDDVEFGKRQAVILPIVKLGSIREVFVLK